jgi:hypothetical protein
MVFEARYAGRCGNCGEAIAAGDSVRFEEDVVVHDICDTSDPAGLRPGEVVCESCWLVKPCGCDA